MLEIKSGGGVDSTIDFGSGGGTLQLDHSVSFSGTIAGFSVPGEIDLADIAFGSSTTLGHSSGTLTVSDGAHVATLAMIGSYTAANFNLADDGNGGTMVTDPPVDSAGHISTPH